MLLIKVLADQACEEAEGMKEYALDAMNYRATRPELSAAYYKMALAEKEHFEILHSFILKAKAEAEKEDVEIPAGMLERWDAKHREMMAEFAEAKALLELYK